MAYNKRLYKVFKELGRLRKKGIAIEREQQGLLKRLGKTEEIKKEILKQQHLLEHKLQKND